MDIITSKMYKQKTNRELFETLFKGDTQMISFFDKVKNKKELEEILSNYCDQGLTSDYLEKSKLSYNFPKYIIEKLYVIKEMISRYNNQNIIHPNKIKHPKEVYNTYKYLSYESLEELHIIYLNESGEVILSKNIARGSHNLVQCSFVDIFHYAIKHLARAIIAVHNHPSENTSPSQEDIKFTKKMTKVSRFFNIHLLDHVIIGRNNYFSFKEKGVI